MLFLLSLGLAKDNQKLISIQAAPPLPRSQPETSVYFCQCICDFCLWGSVAVARGIIIIRYASPQLWFKYCFGKSHCVEHNGVSGGSTSTSISQCMLKVCVYTPHNLRDSLTWISRPYTLWYFEKLRTSLLISRKNSLFFVRNQIASYSLPFALPLPFLANPKNIFWSAKNVTHLQME